MHDAVAAAHRKMHLIASHFEQKDIAGAVSSRRNFLKGSSQLLPSFLPMIAAEPIIRACDTLRQAKRLQDHANAI